MKETNEAVTQDIVVGITEEKLKQLYRQIQMNWRNRQNVNYKPFEINWLGIEFTINARAGAFTNEQQFVNMVWNHLTSNYLQAKYTEFSSNFSLDL